MAVPAAAGRYPGRVVLSRSTHVADLPRPGGGRTLDSSVTAELTGRGAQRGVSHVARRGSSSRGGFGGQRGRCVRAGGVAAAQWAACGCLAAPGGMDLGQTGFDTGGLVGLSGGVLSEVLGHTALGSCCVTALTAINDCGSPCVLVREAGGPHLQGAQTEVIRAICCPGSALHHNSW